MVLTQRQTEQGSKSMAELRNAPGLPEVKDTTLIPAASDAVGTGLFKLTVAALKNYMLAGVATFPGFGGNAGKYLAVNADANGVEWKAVAGGGGGGIAEAPNDGGSYVRKNAAWAPAAAAIASDPWADPNPLVAHRYWRLTAYSSSDSGMGACYISGLIFMDANNADMIDGTVYSLSAGGADPKPQLISRSGASYVALGALPASATVDFGVPKLPAKVSLFSRNGFEGQMPDQFAIEYSDDNVTWKEAMFVNLTQYVSNSEHVYEFRPYIVAFRPAARTRTDAFPTFGKFAFRNKAGVKISALDINADRFVRGSYLPGGSQFAGRDTFVPLWTDVANAGYWGNWNTPTFEVRWPTLPELGTFEIGSRNGYLSQAPSSFTLMTSRDGRSYKPYYTSSDIYWTNGGGNTRIKSFDISSRNA
jgi:hypothetical protein